jgi:hypothetical protein
LAAGISERSNFGCWKLDRAYFFAAGGEDERTRSAAVRTRGNGVRFRVKGASERLKKNKRRVYRSTPNPKARPRSDAPKQSAPVFMQDLANISATLVRTNTGQQGRRPTVMLPPELSPAQQKAVRLFELDRWLPSLSSTMN